MNFNLINNIKDYSIGVVAESKYYIDYRDVCVALLGQHGWEAIAYKTIEEAQRHDVIIVVGMAFFNRVPFYKRKILIGIQGEQLPLPGDTDWSLNRNLKRYHAMSHFYDLVIEWSPVNYLNHKCFVDRIFIPFGAPKGNYLNKSDEWDVVFLGNPYGGKGRRIPILKRLEEECKLCPTREAWGETKFELLNSTKICLNLHQFNSFSYESPRIFELLSEGCFVLTERIANSYPFEDGVHFVSFENEEDLIKKVKFYCNNPEKRDDIARRGKLKAEKYAQELMIERVSLEIQKAIIIKDYDRKRKFKWFKGKFYNGIIELFDLLAKMKANYFQ